MHPNRLLITKFLLLGIFVVLGGSAVRIAVAGTFQGPTEAPPGGNIPITIWNRNASSVTQPNASIAIDGGGPVGTSPIGISVGKANLDMGVSAGGQNLYYGVADYAKMNAADRLFSAQVVSNGIYYDRFYVDKYGSGVFSGAVSMSSTLSAGSIGADLGATTVGNFLIRGVASYEKMNAEDYLLQLRTYSTSPLGYRTNLTVNRNADLKTDGGIEAKGDLHADGCIGKVFIGFTYSGGIGDSGVFQSDVGDYYAANGKCDNNYQGSHVCRSEEILESIECGGSGDPIMDPAINGTFAWIQGGPPGYSAMANDCIGWSTNQANAYGRVWNFNTATGGYGTQTTCNAAGLQFACCR